MNAPLPTGALQKRCVQCGKTKPLGDFYRVHKDSEHRQSRCRKCDNGARAIAMRGSRSTVLRAVTDEHLGELRVPLHRVQRETEEDVSEGEPEEQLEDERSTMLLRGLNPRERDEAERFARVAATLVLAGWRPLSAWDRANELLDQVEPGDPMPALFVDAPAVERRRLFPWMATPPERLVEPPKNIEHMLPRERAVVEFREEIYETPLEVEEEESGEQGRAEATQRLPRHRGPVQPERRAPLPRATGAKAGSTPAAGAASASSLTKERVMSTKNGRMEKILEALAAGKETLADIADAFDGDRRLTGVSLAKLVRQGRAKRELREGEEAHYVASKRESARLPASAVAAPRRIVHRAPKLAKSNGHAAPSTDFATQLRAKRDYHAGIVEKIDALLALEGA